MSARINQRRPGKEPVGTWDRIPGGIRSAIACIPLLVIAIVVNAVISNMPVENAILPVLFFIPQSLIYLLNGFLGASFARGSYLKAIRVVGRVGERVKTQHPNYPVEGIIAGITLAVGGLVLYLFANVAVEQTTPQMLSFLGKYLVENDISPLFFLVADFFFCIGAGFLGSLLYQMTAR